ncbi:MAG: DNA polymerase I, thermostable [Nitrospira sp.]|nr:DNA polymerase I, thermostable [Nitrospira sp.]
MNLFDLIEPAARGPVHNDTWRPEAPPSLSGIDEVYLNFETTGLRWFDKDRPISCSLWAGDRAYYLPWGHAGGGNLDEAVVKEWAKRELRGKLITNINTRFDIHMARVWGVDLEAQGNRVSDVGHYAALLDDHRMLMNLDSLVRDYLKEEPMARLDESKMASYSAGAAAPRSMYNVEVVHRLKQVFWPKLDEEGLQKVRLLEDEVIYVVCEMEKNGTLIDLELLDQWVKDTKREYERHLMELWKLTGLKLNPNSSKDAQKLFQHLKIPMVEVTSSGAYSFTDDVIKGVEHPTVKMFRHAKKLSSINSKLKKYQKSISSDGVLRYALHQLRAAKSDDADAGETGTVTGRFTSTEIVRGEGINIQQVMKPEKQFLTMGDEYFIRDLHLPQKGQLFLSSDAEQIQYRLFANEANNAAVVAAYEADPWMSFHKWTLAEFRRYKPDLSYRRCKDVNFAKLFAAGPSKLALMLGFITKQQFEELRMQKANRFHPLLASTLEILKIYDQALPEVSGLLKTASNLAETRGYIKTIMGRRLRFPAGHDGKRMRLHKAFNGRIQGSEADIVKTKAVELHKNRNYTGMTLRMQVHDEFDGDVHDKEGEKRVGEVLNRQSFPKLRVPILWGVKTGTSWGACSADELKKLREEAKL